jgi:hypothetical protein
VVSIDMPCFNTEPLFRFKGEDTLLINKKTVSASKDKKMWLIISMGRLLQMAENGKPIHIMAKSFPVFPAGNRFSDF